MINDNSKNENSNNDNNNNDYNDSQKKNDYEIYEIKKIPKAFDFTVPFLPSSISERILPLSYSIIIRCSYLIENMMLNYNLRHRLVEQFKVFT